MDNRYAQLVERITYAIATDDDDQSERLADVYLEADEGGKDVLDRAFICLCGYQLKTMMAECVKHETTAVPLP
jgi:hypothetical protein